MYNVTITTTGIFNEIRPSLFPLVEGKEGITFMNALEYSTDDILPFEEGDDITDNGPEIELEHERIRAFIIALCAEHGKPYNELRDEFVKALPEFMLDGTYKGEELFQQREEGVTMSMPCIRACEDEIYYSNAIMEIRMGCFTYLTIWWDI